MLICDGPGIESPSERMPVPASSASTVPSESVTWTQEVLPP